MYAGEDWFSQSLAEVELDTDLFEGQIVFSSPCHADVHALFLFDICYHTSLAFSSPALTRPHASFVVMTPTNSSTPAIRNHNLFCFSYSACFDPQNRV